MAVGLRERKKRKTRDSIQRTALWLFERQGYAQTTIEQIAAAVEISPSTFFNYFPTKEDVVLYEAYVQFAHGEGQAAGAYRRTAQASISTHAPPGSAVTASAVRAG